MASPGQGRQELNRYFQLNGIADRPVWDDAREGGQDHIPTWVTTVKIGGTICGRGTGSNKAEARDAAARETLHYYSTLAAASHPPPSNPPDQQSFRRRAQATAETGTPNNASASGVEPSPFFGQDTMMQKSVGESFISVDSQPPLLQDGLFTPRITPMSSPTVPTSSFRLSPLYSDSSTPTRPRPGLPSSCRTSNAEGSVPVFTCHLKVFLGRRDMRELVIIEDWDDEQILQLLRSTYDEMRGTWRKRLSAKRISEVWLIKHIQGYGCEKSNDSFESPDVYDIPTFMDTPSLQQGKYALKKYLAKICEARDTVQLGVNRDRDAGYELGLKFVESWQAVLIVGAGLLVVVLSTLIVVVCYWIYRRDLSTAFTIAGCIGGLFTILLGLVQLLITVRS